MSRSISQVQVLRRRVALALAVPAALAACQSAADPLGIDPAADPSVPAAAAAVAPALAPDLLVALATDRITFSSFTADGGADIWSMDPQGGTLAHVTSFSGLESEPSWSFDHKRIAFARVRTTLSDIYLVNADGTNKRWARSTSYAGLIDEPSWSPDGTNLLVRVQYQGGMYLGKIQLATGNLALVAPAGVFAVAGSYPSYDPSGSSIIYLDNTYKAIRRFTPGGAQTTLLTSANYLGRPVISPDGTRIAYSVGLGIDNTEIYVLNLATKVTKRLTFNSVDDDFPVWSPDGTRLAFESYRTGKMQIWTMNSSTGGSLVRITSKAYGAVTPSWGH